MIQDSGERREFETGAVRDIQEGKGRCDLLPIKEVAEMLYRAENLSHIPVDCEVLLELIEEGRYIESATLFSMQYFCDVYTGVLEVARHFEEGAVKYGERNWEKGIPCHSYLNSGIRHLIKFYRGDVDERHDRAFVWNMLCLVWTTRNHPELNDIPEYIPYKSLQTRGGMGGKGCSEKTVEYED